MIAAVVVVGAIAVLALRQPIDTVSTNQPAQPEQRAEPRLPPAPHASQAPASPEALSSAAPPPTKSSVAPQPSATSSMAPLSASADRSMQAWLSGELSGHYHEAAASAKSLIRQKGAQYSLFLDAPQAKFDCALARSGRGGDLYGSPYAKR